MAIYFPAELATSVFADEDFVVIKQWTDDKRTKMTGEVCLTWRQFDEMFNRKSQIESDDSGVE